MAHTDLPADLIPVLQACRNVRKSTSGEFSYKWLRSAGNTFHPSKLKKLENLGYLTINYNGITRRGTAWYKLA